MRQTLVTNLLVVMALLLLSEAASAGVRVALDTVRDREAAAVETAQLWIDGDRVRLESTRAGAAAPDQALIFHGDTQQLWQVDLEKRRYTRIDRQQLEALGAQLAAARREAETRLAGLPPEQRAMVERMLGMNAADTAKVTEDTRKTDRREEVGGRACEVFELLRNGRLRGDACVVSWQAIGLEQTDFRVFEQLDEFQQAIRESVGALAAGNLVTSQPFSVFDELGGFPLRVRSLDQNGVGSETNFTSFEKVAIDPTRFEPPTGYSEQPLPLPAAR